MIEEKQRVSFKESINGFYHIEMEIVDRFKLDYFNSEEIEIFDQISSQIRTLNVYSDDIVADRRVKNRLKKRMVKLLEDHDIDEQESRFQALMAEPENDENIRKSMIFTSTISS